MSLAHFGIAVFLVGALLVEGLSQQRELAVKAGDTIDFIVDFRANLNSDEFKWSPVLTELNTAAAAPGAAPVLVKEWDAKKDFRGVDVPAQPALKPWEQLVQVLLSANEFSYVD
mgnify:CR=1 FL=1